jgi:hypothetical protein
MVVRFGIGKETECQLARLWTYSKGRRKKYQGTRLQRKTQTLEWQSRYMLGHEVIKDRFWLTGGNGVWQGNPRDTGIVQLR